MQTSTIKFCGGFNLRRKKHRLLFGASLNLAHGLDPLPFPQCYASHLLFGGSLDFLEDIVIIIRVAII